MIRVVIRPPCLFVTRSCLPNRKRTTAVDVRLDCAPCVSSAVRAFFVRLVRVDVVDHFSGAVNAVHLLIAVQVGAATLDKRYDGFAF